MTTIIQTFHYESSLLLKQVLVFMFYYAG